VPFSGIPLSDLLHEVGATKDANFISFVAQSERNHSSSMRLDEALAENTLIALSVYGQPLPVDHGGPVRNIVPGRYFYKSVKWLRRIELLSDDRLGYWESQTGYHNHADPWKQERYIAPSVDRRTAAKLIESKDFSGRDLRGIDARHRDLTGLRARRALLRDADFRNALLSGADFAEANLSNAHFEDAICVNADFQNADLEGANFSGADLRGARLTGCSLIGASFCKLGSGDQTIHCAKLDDQTKLSLEQLQHLTPEQSAFLTNAIQTQAANKRG
jgi:hypothetical protein